MFTTSHTALRTVLGTFGTVIGAGLCLFGATAPAAAADAPRVTKVSTSDLNLNHVAGRNAFDNRVKLAARSVCANGSGDLRARVEEARCIDAAVSAARAMPVTSTRG
ncbi:MAG: UrcA family protein [Polymorphobacter sp.]